MTKYKCGHESNVIIADCSPLIIAVYLEWKDIYGFGGDKSLCWDCYCKKSRKETM